MNLQTWIGIHILISLVMIIPLLRFHVFTKSKDRGSMGFYLIFFSFTVVDCLVGILFPNYRNPWFAF